MSFSSEVKRELAELSPRSACCAAAQLYGMLELGHAFSAAEISLQTEQEAVADQYIKLLGAVCGAQGAQRHEPARRGGYFLAAVEQAPERLRVLERFGHTARDINVRLNRANLECESCAAAYLRGAFLSCGVITNPAADYHMEFSVPYLALSRDLQTLLRECGFHAKTVCRKGIYVVYFKESEQIEDCLTFMGATAASLELMSVKMVKDIRNNANRIANCESANIDKTVAAAAVHAEAVRKIAAHGGLELLPEELRELAQLRLDNPDLSLRELGEALSPPLSRSGVNHRLKRIVAFAETIE